MSTNPNTDDFFATVATKSDSGALRGDYSQADANYVVAQNWEATRPPSTRCGVVSTSARPS
jgi:phenylalanine-4-hydroxylase